MPFPGALKGSLLRSIAEHLQEDTRPIDSSGPASGALVLVGPPGSGKTTTAAKIAALATITSNRPVRIVGIGAKVACSVARLGAIADTLSLPCEMVFSPDQLAIATTPTYPDELLIVDCAGFSMRDPTESQEWAHSFSVAGLEEVNLVLPANIRPAQMFETAARYQMFEPRSLTFTHMDATDDVTPCLALAVSMHVPVRYVCDGQEIPDDLAVPSSVEIAGQLHPGRAAHTLWN
jgi:flagellar biosynthesis protein FlhF